MSILGNIFALEDDGFDSSDAAPFPAAYSSSTNRVTGSYSRRPAEKRSQHGYVGLLNQGATCYLNSLIQMLYMTPELKNQLYSLSLKELGVESSTATAPTTHTTTTTPVATDIGSTSTVNTTITNTTNPSQEQIESSNNSNNNSNQHHKITIDDSPPPLETFMNDGTLNDNRSNGNGNGHIATMNEDPFTDYDADYVASVLAFGFEEYKVLAGLKRFPHSYQQERLIDWILTSDERDFAAPAPTQTGTYPPSKPSTYTEDDMIGTFPSLLGGDEDFAAFSSLGFEDDNKASQSKAIVVYDAQQQNILPTSNTTTTTTTTITNNVNNLTNESNGVNANNVASQVATVSDISDPQPKVKIRLVTNFTKNKKKKKGRVIAFELQRLFSMLQVGDIKAIGTEDLTNAFGWVGGEAGQQQDIHELNRKLFDAVEHSIKKTSIQDLIVNLYRGVLINRLECTKCGKIKDRDESFEDLPVTIKGFKSLEESLNAMVTPEILDGDNKYFCDDCNEKVKATLGAKLGKLPPILILPLRRFDFDFKRGSRVKITTPFQFPNTIDMSPYTADYSLYEKNKDNGAVKPPTQEYELFSVLIHSGGAYGGHYHAYIKDVTKLNNIYNVNNNGENSENSNQNKVEENVNQDVVLEKENNSNNNNNEVETIQTVVVEKQEEESELGKKLKQQQQKQEEQEKYSGWFDFNDSLVTPIPDSYIAKQFGNKTESAYMLVYRSKSLGSVTSSEIPSHLKQELTSFNSNLEESRTLYDKSINTMFVYPKFIHDYDIQDNSVVEIDEATKKKRMLEKKGDSAQQDDGDAVLQLDVNTTVSELFKLIRLTYADHIDQTEKLVIQEISSIKDSRLTFGVPLVGVSSVNVKKAGIRDGSKLMIWKGASLHGIVSPPIRIKIQHYTRDTTSPVEEGKNSTKIKEVMMSIERDSSFRQLMELIAKETSIPIDSLSIYSMAGAGVVLPMEDDMPNIPLSNRIHNDIALMVEEKTTQGKSLVLEDHEKNRFKIQLFISDRIDLVDPSAASFGLAPPTKVYCDPVSTIYDLKEIILQTNRPGAKNYLIHSTVIRKTQIGGSPGTVISDDTFTLREVGIRDSELLIIERGVVSTPTNTINYILKHGKQKSDPRSINFPRRDTLLQLKKEIMKACEIDINLIGTYVLKTSDMFGTPNLVLNDEEQTLEESGVKNDDVLFLEEGIVASKDQILLRFSLYRLLSENYKSFALPSSPMLHLNPLFSIPTADLFHLIPLNELPIDKKTTVAQLKDLVMEWEGVKESMGVHGTDIRLWNDEKLLSSPAQLNKPLSKLHVQQESSINIEIYHDTLVSHGAKSNESSITTSTVTTNNNSTTVSTSTTTTTTPSNNKKDSNLPPILLYLHRRNPESQTFSHPPQQHIFYGKTIRDLINDVCLMSGIEEQYLKLFKYVTHNKMNPWRIVEERKEVPVIKVNTSTNNHGGVGIVGRKKKGGKKRNQKNNHLKNRNISINSGGNRKHRVEKDDDEDIDINYQLIDQLDTIINSTSGSSGVEQQQQQQQDIDLTSPSTNQSTNSQTPIIGSADVLSDQEEISPTTEQAIVDLTNADIEQLQAKFYQEELDKMESDDVVEIVSDNRIPIPPPPPMKKLGNKIIVNTTNPNELRGKPWLLKDGDMIAFLDTREDPEDNDKFALAMESMPTFKYSGSNNGSGSSFKREVTKYRAPEVELTIQYDDYDDDDEEEEIKEEVQEISNEVD